MFIGYELISETSSMVLKRLDEPDSPLSVPSRGLARCWLLRKARAKDRLDGESSSALSSLVSIVTEGAELTCGFLGFQT